MVPTKCCEVDFIPPCSTPHLDIRRSDDVSSLFQRDLKNDRSVIHLPFTETILIGPSYGLFNRILFSSRVSSIKVR